VNLNFLLSFIVLEGFLPAVPVRNTRRNNASTRRNAIFLANFYSFVSFCVSASTGDFDAQKKRFENALKYRRNNDKNNAQV